MSDWFTQFVGREAELNKIKQWIAAAEQTQLLVLYGRSGIGKTTLLREILRQKDAWARELGLPLHIPAILDFQELEFAFPSHLTSQLTEILGKEWFEESTGKRNHLRYLIHKGAPAMLDELMDETDEAFLQDYEKLGRQKRIVLLVDTLDRAIGSVGQDLLISLIPKLSNTLVIAATQPEPLVLLRRAFEDVKKKEFIGLTGFPSDQISKYLQEAVLPESLVTDLRPKLHLLTGGEPIPLILAALWLRREMPLPELTKMSLLELQALDEAGRTNLQQRFEAALVSKFMDLNYPLDRAVLIAALTDLIDADVLAICLDLPLEKAGEVMVELSQWPLFKKLARGFYSLHEHVRMLILKHVWPNVDPLGTEQLETRRRLAARFTTRANTLREEAEARRVDESKAMDAGDMSEVIRLRQASRSFDLQAEWMEIQAFKHQAPDQAVTQILANLDQATKTYNFLYRDALWDALQSLETRVADDPALSDLYSTVLLQGAKYLLDRNQYNAAYDRLEQLRGRLEINSEQALDMLIQIANVEIRRGHILNGIKEFETALKICEQNPMANWAASYTGRAETGLGWAHRLTGNWQRAKEYYDAALRHSEEQGDDERIALTLNNMGYLYHLQGKHAAALRLCRRALTIWEELQRPRAIATTHYTLGDVYTAQERFNDGFGEYNLALQLFREQEDWEWLALVNNALAYAKWLSGNLEEAWDDVVEAHRLCRTYGIERELPNILHRMGHIVWERTRDSDKAEKHFHESLKVSRRLHDNYQLVDNWVGLAELALQRQEYASIAEYNQEVETCMEQVEPRPEYPLLEGRMARMVAQAQFALKNWSASLEAFKRAFPLLARHGGYGKYRFEEELAYLDNALHSLIENDPARCLTWTDELASAWNAYQDDYPELLVVCSRRRNAAVKRLQANREAANV